MANLIQSFLLEEASIDGENQYSDLQTCIIEAIRCRRYDTETAPTIRG